LLLLGGSGGRARGALHLWLLWERLTAWRLRVRHVRRGGVLRYNYARWRGSPVRLHDGTEIRRGDRIIQLHFDNQALARLAVEGHLSPWTVLRRGRDDLQVLAHAAGAGGLADVRALHGASLFAEAVRRAGFEVRALPRTPRWRLEQFFMVGLLLLYHPRGRRRLAQLRTAPWPAEVWLSRRALMTTAALSDGGRRGDAG
jgi:hypothetical protein